MKLSASVSNRSALVANLYARNERLQVDMRDAVQRFGMDVQQLAKELAPKDTGFMASRIREDYSEGGLRVTVGYHEEDFTGRGLFPYFWVQEFGGALQPAQPHVGPAYRAVLPHFEEDVRQIIRQVFT